MAKASINFQKTKSNSVQETTRQFEAKYLLPKQHRKKNEYWSIGKTDEEIFYTELAKAKRRGGRIPKLENSLWEAVLNLNEGHTLKDVKKVAEHIEKKFNIICTRIAIHRDEGKVFIGKDGSEVVKYNYHAHINFVTYKDGKQNWRRALIRKKDLSQLQTEIAQILGMERGKINSQNIRANHRELRKNYDAIMKQREALEKVQQLEQELEQKNLTVKELKKEIEQYRKELIERNKQDKVYTAEDYRALQALKKELKKDNLTEIYKAFVQLKEEYDKRIMQKDKQIEQLSKVNNSLSRHLLDTQKENAQLKEQVQQLQNAPKPEPQVIVKEKIVYKEDTRKIEQLKKELEEQRRKNRELREELEAKEQMIRELNARLNIIEQKLKESMQKVKELEELIQKKEQEKKQERNKKAEDIGKIILRMQELDAALLEDYDREDWDELEKELRTLHDKLSSLGINVSISNSSNNSKEQEQKVQKVQYDEPTLDELLQVEEDEQKKEKKKKKSRNFGQDIGF